MSAECINRHCCECDTVDVTTEMEIAQPATGHEMNALQRNLLARQTRPTIYSPLLLVRERSNIKVKARKVDSCVYMYIAVTSSPLLFLATASTDDCSPSCTSPGGWSPESVEATTSRQHVALAADNTARHLQNCADDIRLSPRPKYLRDVCTPVHTVAARSRLRSADHGDLVVPHALTTRFGSSVGKYLKY